MTTPYPPLPADPRWRHFRISTAVLTVACVALVLVSVWWGTGGIRVSPLRAWNTLTDAENATRLETVTVDARLSRAVMSIGVGMALAAAGALLQALYRNPLASPEITGVTQGAVVGVVVFLVYAPTDITVGRTWALPAIGAAGGIVAGILTYAVAKLGRRVDPLRLILIGVLMGGLLSSLVAIAIIGSGDFSQDLITWTVGSVQSATWARVRILAIALVVFVPLVIAAIPYANALSLGDDIAQGAGLAVNRARLIVLIAAAALTAAAVSLVGGISFVGLVAPHLVRRFTGADLRRLVPTAALAGAALVAAADFVSRNLRPGDLASALGIDEYIRFITLPTGVYLGLIGAPFFIHILRRRS
ncbi:MAG: iron ABC transporter permease [Actinomycetota bacterium]